MQNKSSIHNRCLGLGWFPADTEADRIYPRWKPTEENTWNQLQLVLIWVCFKLIHLISGKNPCRKTPELHFQARSWVGLVSRGLSIWTVKTYGCKHIGSISRIIFRLGWFQLIYFCAKICIRLEEVRGTFRIESQPDKNYSQAY